MAAAIALILLVATLILIGLNHHQVVMEPRHSVPTAPRQSVRPAPSSPSIDLVTAPADVRWKDYRGIALPVSTSAGPTDHTAPVVAGYTHTPAGALVAACQINARMLITPNGGWRKVLEAQVMPSVGRDAYAKMRATVGDEAPPAGWAQYAGFRFVTYTDELTVITVATRSADGTLQMANETLTWSGDDWRLILPASGLGQPQVIADLSGYTPWGQS
ncbi:hypothetical protein [Enterococcus hirae]|uniref:hypothetical protein n=1 Tax=Enterococcus hirae TaxID=1354 RepID=UPI0019663E65|nr:hypothetical protein [Enterococcus hirae]